MSKKSMVFILMASIALIIVVPFTIEIFIFRNEYYSVLTNGEWSGFLGSYIGGVFGGIGTLLAVYITTNQTRMIQDSDLKRFENEQQKSERNERKIFADKIAENIAAYITDISKYYYMCCYTEDLCEKEQKLNVRLREITVDIRKNHCKLSELNKVDDDSEYLRVGKEIDKLKQEESEIMYKLQTLMKDKEFHKVDRSIAVELYFLLNIQLKGVKYADDILKQLELIHKNSGMGRMIDFKLIEEDTNKLMEITIEFIKKYVG